MRQRNALARWTTVAVVCGAFVGPGLSLAESPQQALKPAEETKPVSGIVGTYRITVIEEPFDKIKQQDEADKPKVMERQNRLLEERYDLSNRPSNVMMSGGRRAVQEGAGATHEGL